MIVHNSALILPYDQLVDSLPPDSSVEYSRRHLSRRVKQRAHSEQQIPLPPGRVLVNVHIDDPALDHSYAALSTLSDLPNGIDAGIIIIITS